MTEREHIDVQRGYDRWAEIYDHEGNPLVALEEPVVRGWLGSVAGLCVADVGCGTGRHTLWLAEHGAEVHAFDASAGMLAKARQKVKELDVHLHEHTLPDPLPAENASFDVVILALVADHLADLGLSMRELARVLKLGGTLILTTLHPAMNLRGITARFTDPQGGHEVRVEAFEHSFADYVLAVLRAGLLIDDIIEQLADQALAARVPRAEKYIGWPMLLAIRGHRPSN